MWRQREKTERERRPSVKEKKKALSTGMTERGTGGFRNRQGEKKRKGGRTVAKGKF